MRFFNMILFIIAITNHGCEQTPYQQRSGIDGIWTGAVNDSVYLEMIFLPKEMHLKDSSTGNLLIISKALFYYTNHDPLSSALFSFELENDSLIIHHRGVEMDRGSVRLKGKELLLDSFNLRLIPLPNDDFEDFLKIDTLTWDNNYFNKYLKAYQERRARFESGGTWHGIGDTPGQY
jgi:hypothetical protein